MGCHLAQFRAKLRPSDSCWFRRSFGLDWLEQLRAEVLTCCTGSIWSQLLPSTLTEHTKLLSLDLSHLPSRALGSLTSGSHCLPLKPAFEILACFSSILETIWRHARHSVADSAGVHDFGDMQVNMMYAHTGAKMS